MPQQPFRFVPLDGFADRELRDRRSGIVVFGQDAGVEEQLDPAIIRHLQYFRRDLALAEALRSGLLAAALGIDAFRLADDICLDKSFAC